MTRWQGFIPAARRSLGSHRVVGLDVARCVALLGMMAAHILPATAGGRVTWAHALTAGRASGLFAVLAGTSISLMSGGATVATGRKLAHVRRALVVRAGLIALIGLALDKLHDKGIGVILPYYGLLFLLGIPLLRVPARNLFQLAALSCVLMPVLSQLLRPHLPDTTSIPLHELTPLELLCDLGLTGNYPALPWLTFLLVGLAVGRLRLDRTAVVVRIALAGAAVAVVASVVSDSLTASRTTRADLVASWERATGQGATWEQVQTSMGVGLSGTTPTDTWRWLAVQAAHSGTPFDLAQTTGCALLAVALCVLAARSSPKAWGIAFGAGAMSLTSYSLHLVMMSRAGWLAAGAAGFSTQAAIVLGLGAGFATLKLKGPLEGVVAAASQYAARHTARLDRRREPGTAGIDQASAAANTDLSKSTN